MGTNWVRTGHELDMRLSTGTRLGIDTSGLGRASWAQADCVRTLQVLTSFTYMFKQLRATLDEGPRSRLVQSNRARAYWMRAINWTQHPLDETPRPKSGKLRLNLHGTIFWRETHLV
jgi:hypothetical protein